MPGFFPLSHFHAILYRKLIMIKRSISSFVTSIIGTLIFCALAIILQALMRSMMVQKKKPLDFNRYPEDKNTLFLIYNESEYTVEEFNKYVDLFRKTYYQDRKSYPNILTYTNLDDLHRELIENKTKGTLVHSPGGFYFKQKIDVETQKEANYVIIYNSTAATIFSKDDSDLFYGYHQMFRVLWKSIFGEENDIQILSLRLLRKLADKVFSQLGPMLIACGLISIVPTFISQPITDIRGEVRQYMVSCTLKLAPYWCATFLIDLCIWVILVTLVWAIFLICQVQSCLDNIFNFWYVMVFLGPSFILFCYCFSFCFASAETAPRQTFLVFIVLLLVPMIVSMIRDDTNPVWLDWIYSIFPHMGFQQNLQNILQTMGDMKQNISFFFKYEHTKPYLIMNFVDIVIYGIILTLIELFRDKISRAKARSSFSGYSDVFKEAKAKHPVTKEAYEMEKEVHDRNNEFAIRIENVSRLFMNTAGQPIPAVNCVSLGIKENSLFGFLGANGAGKTTLIRIITGMLPPSDGTIEIFGTKIEDLKDNTLLSICPQFNNHLCDELTPNEHFILYSYLFKLNKKETLSQTDKLMRVLELDELKDKPIRELSAGDVRKLAIALSFLGPAKIILLDEPTASLDPVARHHVHEMILENKNNKTFMLCTHLLGEAETLCDNISIMIKGNVYTVGSPQYLTQKFGTEFKIDVMLKDDEDAKDKVDKFFETKLPDAVLSIQRPKARIYSIDANIITLPKLFKTMQTGSDGDNGFNYFTCTSSSLERVFMEIVHMSEGNDAEMKNHEDVQQSKSNSTDSESTEGTDNKLETLESD